MPRSQSPEPGAQIPEPRSQVLEEAEGFRRAISLAALAKLRAGRQPTPGLASLLAPRLLKPDAGGLEVDLAMQGARRDETPEVLPGQEPTRAQQLRQRVRAKETKRACAPTVSAAEAARAS